MKCSCTNFKRKLALLSLAVLASLLAAPQASAMEKDDSYSETEIEIKLEEGEPIIVNPEPKILKRKEGPESQAQSRIHPLLTEKRPRSRVWLRSV